MYGVSGRPDGFHGKQWYKLLLPLEPSQQNFSVSGFLEPENFSDEKILPEFFGLKIFCAGNFCGTVLTQQFFTNCSLKRGGDWLSGMCRSNNSGENPKCENGFRLEIFSPGIFRVQNFMSRVFFNVNFFCPAVAGVRLPNDTVFLQRRRGSHAGSPMFCDSCRMREKMYNLNT
jgi:hypothetical protein